MMSVLDAIVADLPEPRDPPESPDLPIGGLGVPVTAIGAGPKKKALLGAMARLGLDDTSRVLVVGKGAASTKAAESAAMPFADIAASPDGTLAGAVSAWVERRAGERIEKARAVVGATDAAAGVDAGHLHDSLTKPPGSLGRLESLGVQLAAIAGSCPPPLPEPAAVVVFAADHGVVSSGVSSWPQEVTAQMVSNFAGGGAAVSVLARQMGATVTVVDVGVASPIPGASGDVITRTVRNGTADLATGPAMSRTEALLALDVGVELAERCVSSGARCLITGDMGIGNTTASAAIISAATGEPAAKVTGRGAGASDETLARKIEVITVALERLNGSYGANGPLALLE